MRWFCVLLCFLCFSFGGISQEEKELNYEEVTPLNELLEKGSPEQIEFLKSQALKKNSFEQSEQTTIEQFNFAVKSVIKDPVLEPEIQPGGSDQAVLERIVKDGTEENKRLVTGPTQYDSRIELLELSILNDWERKILENSRSVAMIIHRDQLWELSDSLFALDVSATLQQRLNVCPEESYSNQLSVGVGTAFVIGEDSMMTANHVFEENIAEYVVVFNFEAINRTGAVNAVIKSEDVYEIEELYSEDEVLDIAQFRVSRKLSAPVLKLSDNKTLKKDDRIYMIGHPSGLPKKVALNARVYENPAFDYFYSTLDAFQGNSGSPVFSISKNEVVGVLVSGEQDFYWSGNCNKSTLCELPYCQGEKVIRIERTINE